MRFLVKVNIPGRGWESGGKSRQTWLNNSVHTGGFEARGGLFHRRQRSTDSFLFLEMADASQIPAIAESWFLALNASIEIHPVMIPEDLARASGAIDAAAKKYS